MQRIVFAALCAAFCHSCQGGGDDAPTEVNVPEPPTANEWRDPVTDRAWFAATTTGNWQDASDACQGSYRLPDVFELRLARARGMCDGRTCGTAWSVSVLPTDALAFDFTKGEAKSMKKDQQGQIFCIRED